MTQVSGSIWDAAETSVYHKKLSNRHLWKTESLREAALMAIKNRGLFVQIGNVFRPLEWSDSVELVNIMACHPTPYNRRLLALLSVRPKPYLTMMQITNMRRVARGQSPLRSLNGATTENRI